MVAAASTTPEMRVKGRRATSCLAVLLTMLVPLMLWLRSSPMDRHHGTSRSLPNAGGDAMRGGATDQPAEPAISNRSQRTTAEHGAALAEQGSGHDSRRWASGMGQRAQGPAANASHPLVLVSDGCSGSSWILNVLKELLRTTVGVRLCNLPGRDWEVLRQPFRSGRHPSLDELAEGILTTHAKCTAKGRTFFFKGKHPSQVIALARTLNAMGARVALTQRANMLDRVLCDVRDCFKTKAGLSGTNVFARDGTRANSCHKSREQPWRAASIAVNITDMDLFLQTLRRFDSYQTHLSLKLEAAGLGPRPILPITYEELALSGHSPERMRMSVAGFRRIMLSFGYDVPEERIREVLQPSAGGRPKPRPHRELVYNYDELRSALIDDDARCRHSNFAASESACADGLVFMLRQDESS